MANNTKNIIGTAGVRGLILAEGDVWKKQRHRYFAMFAARNLPVLSRHFAESGMEVADRLAATEVLVKVAKDAPPATIANICCVMFTVTRR